ncbi:MAG: DUF2975 domain-containing protein [Bacillota bacterium]|jgi:hypothetical protein
MRIETQGIQFIFHEGAEQVDPPWLLVMNGVVALPMLLLALFVIYQLRKVFGSVAGGCPFEPGNPGRIRLIGIAICISSAVRSVGSFLGGWFIEHAVNFPGIEVRALLRPDLNTLFLGLVVMVLSEVFRYGSVLQEDHDLTV